MGRKQEIASLKAKIDFLKRQADGIIHPLTCWKLNQWDL